MTAPVNSSSAIVYPVVELKRLAPQTEPVQQIYNRWIKEYAQPASELLTRLKDELEEELV